MAEDWRVVEMILTVQVAEEMRLAAQTNGQSPRQSNCCAKLPSNAGTHGNGHSSRSGPL